MVVGLFVSWACVTPQGATPSLRPEQLEGIDGGAGTLPLGQGDVLEVRVYGEADLSGVYTVLTDGHINFPLCGRVRVAGTSTDGAAAAVTDCLGNGYLKRPRVTVELKAFNSLQVFVFGEIPKPGAFAFSPGMTIIHAVSQAGGFSKAAAKNSVNITRRIDGKEVKIPVRVEDIVVGREKNVPLQPGDIIFIPESFL
jgi:protein involved in polysaccharide export with SLBB domain